MADHDITLRTGQAVPWPPSPSGFAQVVELRTRTVRIGYRNTRGRWRQPIVPLAEVTIQQLLFELDNPYDRGLIKREKTYGIRSPRCR